MGCVDWLDHCRGVFDVLMCDIPNHVFDKSVFRGQSGQMGGPDFPSQFGGGGGGREVSD